jgi:hypothetical protein
MCSEVLRRLKADKLRMSVGAQPAAQGLKIRQ